MHGEAPITVEEYFTFLSGGHWKTDVLQWPPDVYCLLAAILQKTGGYIRLVSNWPPEGAGTRATKAKEITRWGLKTERWGRDWWYYSSKFASGINVRPPDPIANRWKVIHDSRKMTLDELGHDIAPSSHRLFWNALFELCAAADEACAGIGIAHRSRHRKKLGKGSPLPPRDFLYVVRRRLINQSFLEEPSTLTKYIRSSFAAVLPKFHTPQSGITLRSISHNLAFLRTSEIVPNFVHSGTGIESKQRADEPSRHALNFLLVPWPARICPAEFSEVPSNIQQMSKDFGFFSFVPKLAPTIANRSKLLRKILKEAEKETGRIDGVVFPELALSEADFAPIFDVIKRVCEDCFIIAGVGNAGINGKPGTNKAVYKSSFGAYGDVLTQHKHHRWQLDRKQIEQYGLGSQLDPTKLWWEHIEIKPRRFSFLSITDRIALSVLICEDLARQDPISDMIRAVGPNLVVALLMDGPQLRGRWPAHYATVFAEDPGSSVLTFTSLGMTELSRPPETEASRIVGLWRDKFGGFRQIELAEDAEAVVLSLTVEEALEWTADGRKDKNDSSYLRLNGIRQITV